MYRRAPEEGTDPWPKMDKVRGKARRKMEERTEHMKAGNWAKGVS